MRKTTKYLCITSLAVLTLLPGCGKWLDVQPQTQIEDKTLFKEAYGFRSSLNGIYVTLASPDLYGRNLTWGLPSFMGQDYATDVGDVADKAAKAFDYQNKSLLKVTSDVWTTAYNVIANCNKLAMEIEDKAASSFPQGESERSMILGEAIAVRAMLHLDMIRLFAPAPATGDTKAYVPYYRDFTVEFESALPVREALAKVIEDLLQARDLVKQNDTETHPTYMFAPNSEVRFNVTNRATMDAFFMARGIRLNWVAIGGLLARAYLYAGDVENARKYALEIYTDYSPDAPDPQTNTWFFTRVFNEEPHVKLIDDALFALSDQRLVTKVDEYVGRLGNPLYLRAIRSGLSTLDGDDHRLMNLIQPESANERCRKWQPTGANNEDSSSREYTLIPIIRMSEIYYILAETMCGYDQDMANTVYNQMRKHRGQSRAVSGENDILEDLVWEYRKEFMTEGQTFFMFKRLNKAIRTTEGSVMPQAGYVIPVPDNEKI